MGTEFAGLRLLSVQGRLCPRDGGRGLSGLGPQSLQIVSIPLQFLFWFNQIYN